MHYWNVTTRQPQSSISHARVLNWSALSSTGRHPLSLTKAYRPLHSVHEPQLSKRIYVHGLLDLKINNGEFEPEGSSSQTIMYSSDASLTTRGDMFLDESAEAFLTKIDAGDANSH